MDSNVHTSVDKDCEDTDIQVIGDEGGGAGNNWNGERMVKTEESRNGSDK